jgi:hypothetical protein
MMLQKRPRVNERPVKKEKLLCSKMYAISHRPTFFVFCVCLFGFHFFFSVVDNSV